MSRGSLSRICRTPKVLMPKYSDVRGSAPFSPSASVRTSRSVISWMTALRADKEDAGMSGGLVDGSSAAPANVPNVSRFRAKNANLEQHFTINAPNSGAVDALFRAKMRQKRPGSRSLRTGDGSRPRFPSGVSSSIRPKPSQPRHPQPDRHRPPRATPVRPRRPTAPSRAASPPRPTRTRRARSTIRRRSSSPTTRGRTDRDGVST